MNKTTKNILGLATLAGLAVYYSSLPPGSATRAAPGPCEDTTGAFVISQSFVTKALRAPSTAEFPWINSDGVKVINRGDCRFTVHAYVDAQNAFGGTVRTNYIIDLRRAGEQWFNEKLVML